MQYKSNRKQRKFVMKKMVVINPLDNVGVLLQEQNGIPAGHKVALRKIRKGESVIKYGMVIGKATKDIQEGEWVHTQNLKSHLDESFSYTYKREYQTPKKEHLTFKGYLRDDGRAGIRNDIYIIPTVGCVNGVCKRIEQESQKFIKGSIDSIFALPHQFGCSQLGEDAENIKKLLCSIALNPNATYVLFVGLGCENNSLSSIKEYLDSKHRKNVFYYNCQEVEDEVAYGLKIIEECAAKASKLRREEVSLDKLVIGLKCGGSDGFSGITANPTIGKVADRVISCGGSAVLTEVPEMFGAEQTLMNKCVSKDVYERFITLINNFKQFYLDNNFPIYENPSPGNKAGGITTLEEKSCGCITKAGSSPVVDVLDYGDVVVKNGLNILNGPGNDLIAATALAASGCQLILFSTGRGTPLSTFVPTLKIGTNNHLSEFKDRWIDFNAYSLDDSGLFDLLLKTISGEYKTKNESNKEMAFYKKGVTL